jgi:hypothetical protein
MSNSKLICYTRLSPNCNKPRSHKIDTITIHHMAGNLTVEQCGEVFAPVSRQASSNYGIGSDGRIALYVDEANRSWCSSNAENDHRAVTIEVANDGGEPDWHVSDKALAALIELCADICQRNGIKKLNYTGDKSGNLTMHKWFAATGCPGPYLGGKFPYIAAEVNKRLSAATSTPSKYMTYDQFEKKYLGKAVDFDGVAGVQCVDLFDQYLKECFGITGVWCDGAKDLYNKFESYPALVKAFERIPNTRELIVRKGDVVIWGGGSWGHVGIGNGEGDEDRFVTLEENTLGRHEPTQLVKHYFNGSGGNDGCNPVLGVLRPKSAAEPALKPLDTAIWYKRGDKDKPGEHAIFAIKQRMKALGYKLDDTGGFGGGTEKAVNDLLRLWGYKQNGVIGEKFVRLVMR